jgi:hypothetical protein
MAIEAKYGKIDIPGIPENEPVFIMRAQDAFAGYVLEQYANLREGAGDFDGASDVMEVRASFQDWPTKKIPD